MMHTYLRLTSGDLDQPQATDNSEQQKGALPTLGVHHFPDLFLSERRHTSLDPASKKEIGRKGECWGKDAAPAPLVRVITAIYYA
jgi:hypothetical protein